MKAAETAPETPDIQAGLAGVVSHRSSISSIIGATLTYRGIDIDALAENATFEEVIGLLWNGSLPAAAELEALQRSLQAEFHLPEPVIKVLRAFPPEAEPMRVLQAGMAVMGMVDPDGGDNSPAACRRKAPRITSQLSAVTCGFHRLRSGKDLVTPSPKLGFAGNFFLLLNGREPEPVEERALDKALLLHADHELNASTFSARVTASTLADAHTALAAAIGTLDRVDSWLEAKLARKEKIMGIGHRVYKQGDPRAKHLKKMSKELGELTGQPHWYAISERIEAEMRARRGLLPNVDFYSATTYYCLGIPPDLFTPIFAASRVTGWLAHLFEQYAENELIRPRALDIGPRKAHWIPIASR
jgi:citrate synthase